MEHDDGELIRMAILLALQEGPLLTAEDLERVCPLLEQEEVAIRRRALAPRT